MRLILFNNVTSVDDGSTSLSNYNDVPDEKISIFNVDNGSNLDLTGANASERMQIVQGNSNGRAVVSPIFDKDDVLSVNTATYSAPVKQKTTVAYDGSNSEDIPVTADERYRLKVSETGGDLGTFPNPQRTAEYTAESGDFPITIAKKIATQFNKIPESINQKRIAWVDILSAQASTQLQDDDATPANVTFAVTQGSSSIIATVTNGASISGLSAGDWIRLGHATDDAYPVYKVKEVKAASGTEQEVVLERVYAGETATGVAAGKLDAAPDGSDAAGLTILAEEAGIGFETGLTDSFGNIVPSISATPEKGTGSYDQVRKTEEDFQGSEGFLYRMTAFQGDKPEYFADSSLDYDLVMIKLKNEVTRNIGGPEGQHVLVVLAYEEGTLAAGGVDFSTFFGV